jgi:hypothetical protein
MFVIWWIGEHLDVHRLLYFPFDSFQLSHVFNWPDIPVFPAENVVNDREDENRAIP